MANDPNAGMNRLGGGGNDEVARAAAAMDAAQAKVERDFESSQPWTDGVTEFESAKRAYYKARADVVKTLATREDYSSAVRASAAADQQVQALHGADQTATTEALHRAATAALAARTAVTQIESTACAADPAVSAAQTRGKSAAEALHQLRIKERAEVTGNADWQAAKQRYESAKTQQVMSGK
jgi:hypothetical protein